AGAVAQEQALLVAVEHAVRGLGERRGRGQQARDELLRARQRKHALEELREEAVPSERAFEVVKATQRARAEQLGVALVEAAQQRHAKTLARGGERKAGRQRGLRQLGHV